MPENKCFVAEYIGVTFFCSRIYWDYVLETNCGLRFIMLKFERVTLQSVTPRYVEIQRVIKIIFSYVSVRLEVT